MNRNYIIVIILIIVGIAGFWIGSNNPWSNVRPAQMPQAPMTGAAPQMAPAVSAMIAELECPCDAHPGKHVHLNQCNSEFAKEMKDAINQMAGMGLDKERIIAHLGMMGFIDPDADPHQH